MNLVFIHGWSVTNTSTYGDLPKVLNNMLRKKNKSKKFTYIFR